MMKVAYYIITFNSALNKFLFTLKAILHDETKNRLLLFRRSVMQHSFVSRIAL